MKIFNFESKILTNKTIEKEGYDPVSLSNGSHKYIWSLCRFCGNEIRIQYRHYVSSSSSCHRKCRNQEQKLLPSSFGDTKVREKIKKTNLKKYGYEYALHNKDIRKKIEKTNIKKYGCKNVLSNKEIKEKVESTNIKKYGSKYPIQNIKIKRKRESTCYKQYGYKSPFDSPQIQNLIKNNNIKNYNCVNAGQRKDIQEKIKNSIQNDRNSNFKNINTLRNNKFWDLLKGGLCLKEACLILNINYKSIVSSIQSKEFKSRFQQIYSFPKHQGQNDICNYIKQYTNCECIINDRKIIRPYELDIYIPDKKLAIEFNGSYWHSEAFLSSKSAKYKHYNKTQKCKEIGVRLIHIFEYDWETKKQHFLNIIKSATNSNTNRIYARKCSVNHDICVDFLRANHIQGSPHSALQYFNLVYKNEIVCSMTASRHHRQNSNANDVVLSRLCFKNNTSIPGGSSRLFKQFVRWSKSEGYQGIISWSDNAWTEGNIYKVLDFKMSKEYQPDYFYWDSKSNKYKSKQSQKKSSTKCPDGLTEKEWCAQNGLFRIWNCGKNLWRYEL